MPTGDGVCLTLGDLHWVGGLIGYLPLEGASGKYTRRGPHGQGGGVVAWGMSEVV